MFKWYSVFVIGLWLVIARPSVHAQIVINELPVSTLDNDIIEAIYGIDWRIDGQFLAVATDSGVWIYTLTLKEIAHLSVEGDWVYDVSWSPDGSKLAGGGKDAKVHIWDVSDLSNISIISELPESNSVLDVAWSPDETSNQIATRVFESIEYFSDAAVSYSSVHVWDILTGQVIQTPIINEAGLVPLSWSSNGERFVTNRNKWDADYGFVLGGLMLWDIQTNRPIMQHLLPAPVIKPLSLAWRPNTNTFVASDDAGYVLIYDENLQEIGGLTDANWTGETMSTSAWNFDGSKLALGSDEGWINIWNMNIGQQLARIQGHTSGLVDLDWNPNDVYLASAAADGELKIWNVSGLPTLVHLPTVTPFPPLEVPLPSSK